jgi:hypothetical protein
VTNPFTKKKMKMPVTACTVYIDKFKSLAYNDSQQVHEVPASLVDELADANNLRAVAAKWAACRELRPAKTGDLAELLVPLQGLARLARTRKRSLLLWNCT